VSSGRQWQWTGDERFRGEEIRCYTSINNKVSFIRYSLVRTIWLYVFFHITRRKHHITNTFNYSLIHYSVIRFIRSYVLNQTRFRKEIIHLCVITCQLPHCGDQFASRGATARFKWLKYAVSWKLSVHWTVAARGLPVSETAIETVKRHVFPRPLSEEHISVVAKCGSFVVNLSQSKKQLKIDVFFLNGKMPTRLHNKMFPSCFRFFVF